MKFKITLLLLLSLYTGFAQVTNEGRPLSWKLNDLETVKPIAMPKFDLAALQAEDKANELRKDMPWRFGYEFFVDNNLTNSGNWHTLPNGDRVWRIRYTSTGAKTLNFLFSDFYMPAGAKVYLYNDAHTDLLGAYDARQNNAERVLGTWLVQGSDIWIEYYEPAAVTGQGKLEIFKVVHGYRTQDEALTKAPDDDLNGSGNCNVDVDCFMADVQDFKNINKRAVGLIIANNSSFCSGGLVNNTANDGTPYFLTANHCYSNPSQWAFRFNWISPNPVCATTANSTTNAPNFYQTLSGATLRARRADSDFMLVQITANIPTEWDLVYAGWDRSTTAPASVFGIHHPSGDIMKACRDFGPVTTEATMWRIENWDIGVTEGGSSGSPIYDNFGRLRGQLYGGASACTGTTDNGGYDVYGRFDVSWNGTGNTTRLSNWLDPLNTGAVTLDFYPPVLALDAKASVFALNQDECGASLSPVARIENRGSTTITSATISYSLNNGTAATINWTGSIAANATANVTLPQLQGTAGANTLTVTVSNPNNTTDGNVNNNTAISQFNVRVYAVSDVNFALLTDDYGDETSWELRNEAGTLLYSGQGYDDNQTVNVTFSLPNEGCYTFTIYDEAQDGICCFYGEGSYSLTTAGGQVIATGGSYAESETVTFALSAAMSVKGNSLKDAVRVYPNPSAGIYNINVSGGYTNLSYQLYNMLGQSVSNGSIATNGTINITNAANGVYMLKVAEPNGKTATFKLVKE
jgi:lysyl endopeptidase